MAFKIGDLFWKIKGDTKDIDRGLKDTDSKVEKTKGTFSKAGAFITAAFAGVIIAGITRIGKELISVASDAEETRNKFNVTFSDIKDTADATAENLADNFGISQSAAEDLLASTGDLLSGFGFTQAAALDLSEQTNTLAADLASFANVPVKQASDAITKGLLGEREAMKNLGIAITEADIKQLAEDKGIVGELGRQEKAMLTLELATLQSKNAIGDFSRSQGSFANQSKIAQAAVEDLKVELGQRLLPIATSSVSIFADLAGKLADFVRERNKLVEAKLADQEGNATLEQQLLLLQRRKDELKETADAYSGYNAQGLVDNKNTQDTIDRNKQALDTVNAQIQAIAARQRAEAMQSKAERDIAEQEAREAEERARREEERLADINRRDEAYEKTEAGRIAAIEEEIAYYETFKESDEKAQIVLANLREELQGLKGDTEDATTSTSTLGTTQQNLVGQALVPMTNAAKTLWREYGEGVTNANDGTVEAKDNLLDLESVTSDFIGSSLSGFEAVGQAIYEGADAAAVLGAAVLNSGADILKTLGAELAARAAVALIAGNIPGAVLAGAASAAAYTAAGVVGAAASSMTATPTAPRPETTTPAPTTDTSKPTRTTSGGGDIIINNLIALGKEAEFREAAKQLYPYLESERSRRGE